MRLCKKIFRIASLAFIILMLMSGTVLAAYSYYAAVQVRETGGDSYSYLPIIVDIDNNYLVDNSYISLTGLDTRILSGSTELKHLVTDDKVLFVIPLVEANSTGSYRYTLGNDPLDDFPIITGVDGYITIGVDADLEPAADFEFELRGYIDTASGADKNLVYKEDAFRIWVSDTEEISAAIIDTSTNMRQDLKFYVRENQNSTYYIGLMGCYSRDIPTETDAAQIIPTAGTLSRLYIHANVNPGENYQFTVMKNGAATNINATVSSGVHEASDLTHSVDVVAGDTVSIRIVANGDIPISGAIVFESDTPNETIYMSSRNLQNDGEDNYRLVTGGGYGNAGSTYAFRFEGDGTAKKLYVKSTADPGDNPEGYSYTLIKDGAPTALTTTITADDVTGNDVVNTVDLTSGDLIGIKISPVNTPTVEPLGAVSFVVLQDTKYEQQVMGYQGSSPGNVSTRYTPIILDVSIAWTYAGNEADAAQVVAIRQTLSDFTMLIQTAPSGGESRTFTIMKNGVATDLTVTISDTDTAGTDSTHTVILVAGDVIYLRTTPSDSATATLVFQWSLLSTTSEYLTVVTVPSVTSELRTVKVSADGTDLTLEVYDENDLLIGSDTTGLGGERVPIQATDWILSKNEVMPYMEYYKHTVSDTLIAWYQPISMIIGTTLDDREGTDAGETGTAEEDGTITWGTNPVDLSATIGSLISSSQPEIVPAGEEGILDIVPEGEVPAAGGVVNTTKLENNPIHPFIAMASDYTGYTEEQIWFMGATFIILIGMGGAVVKVPNHLVLASTVGLVLGGFFTAMEIYQWWMMLIFGAMFLMSILMERKPVF